MNTSQDSAATWAAPLFSHLHTVEADSKRTHKLPQMPCVLWLPDYGAYLRSLNLFQCAFTTSPNAEGAMRLGEQQAVAIARDLIDTTGVRVSLRHYVPSH